MIQLRSVSKAHGLQPILVNSTVHLPKTGVVALVGPNGIGKTTLLRLIAGIEAPDSGTVDQQGARIGYLRQHLPFDDPAIMATPVIEWVAPGIKALEKLQADLESLALQMADADPESLTALLAEMAEAQTAYDLASRSDLEPSLRKLLRNLGLTDAQIEQPIGELSGGYRMRLPMAQLLALEPQVLLLDEPTNHLDIDALIWLETFLQQYKGCVIMTSHDRSFLDHCSSHVLTIDNHELWMASGNYATYEQYRDERYEQQIAMRDKQIAERDKLEAFVKRFGAKASKARQASSKKKQLEKLPDIEVMTVKEFVPRFPKPDVPDGPKIFLQVEELSGGYDFPLFRNLDWTVKSGAKVALVGPNGVGKSTLLKTITGHIPALSGEVITGPRVETTYYAQDAIEALNPEQTVWEAANTFLPDMPEQHIRGLLGAALFSADDIHKYVATLSGGEKARLTLSLILSSPANMLVLDEPTNHLDAQSRVSLARLLRAFKGTVIAVSHDRYFLNIFVDTVVDIHADSVTQYPGTMREYEQRHRIQPQHQTAPNVQQAADKPKSNKSKAKPTASAGEIYKAKKRLNSAFRKATRDIEKLESVIEDTKAKLGDPANSSDYQQLTTWQQDLNTHRTQLEEANAVWEKVIEEAEEFGIDLDN